MGEDGEALALRPRSGLGFCGAEERLADIFFLFTGEITWDSIPGHVEGVRGVRRVRLREG